jgi:hypothetical protein
MSYTSYVMIKIINREDLLTITVAYYNIVKCGGVMQKSLVVHSFDLPLPFNRKKNKNKKHGQSMSIPHIAATMCAILLVLPCGPNLLFVAT